MSVFGMAQQLSHGQMVITILIAMFAMMLIAVSYGRMASVYPSAGLPTPISALTAQFGAAPIALWHGPGERFAQRIFGSLNRPGTPVFNIIFIAVITLAGCFAMPLSIPPSC